MGDNGPVRFLSAEWLERMAAATTTASPGADVVVHQRVTGGPEGDVEYVLRARRGTVSFEPGPAADADVTLVTDYATASAISQGRLSPASAFAAGRLRVIGSVGPLVASQEVFGGLGRLLAGVSEATTY